MALNPLGVLDLSVVTDLLIQTITSSWTDSPLWDTLIPDAFFTPVITGLTPEAVRKTGGCQITVSLIHIEPNKSQRNFVYPPTAAAAANPVPPRAQMIPALPLGLDLFYFITAYSPKTIERAGTAGYEHHPSLLSREPDYPDQRCLFRFSFGDQPGRIHPDNGDRIGRLHLAILAGDRPPRSASLSCIESRLSSSRHQLRRRLQNRF